MSGLPSLAHAVRPEPGLSGAVRQLAWRGLALLGLAISSVPPAAAQPSLVRFEDDAYAVFGRRDGIPDTPIHSLEASATGGLLLATADGVRVFDGRRWTPLTPPEGSRSTRVVFDRANGDRVFVTSGGLVVQRAGRFLPPVSLAPADIPLYAAVAAPRRGGGDDVLVSGTGGVFQLDSTSQRLFRVPLPVQMTPRDAMIAARLNGAAAEVWVGTRGGGVARRRDGVWTRWGTADGLGSLIIEQVVLAPIGDTLSALAATPSGAFALTGNRWGPIGPRVSVTRVLRVKVGLHYETWLGTFGGELYRSRDDRQWELVDLTARIRGSRTQVLTAIDHGLGVPTIYAAFRSGNLIRFRIGLAGRLALPPGVSGYPIIAISNATDRGSFWTWMQGLGLVQLPQLNRVPATEAMTGGGDGRVRLRVHHTTDDREVPFMAIEGRLYRYQQRAWSPIADWSTGEYFSAMVSAFGPNRRPGLVALANGGAAIVYDDGTVARWDGFPVGIRSLLVDSTTTPSTLVAVSLARRVSRFDGQRWSTLPGEPLPARGAIVGAAFVRPRSGERSLLVATTDGLAQLRLSGGAPTWRVLNDSLLPALRSDEASALTGLAPDRLAVGTTQGVTVIQFDSTFAGGVRAAYSINDADGLPHSNVLSLGPLDRDGRLWVGTTLGLGYINTTDLERPRAPLRVANVDMRDGTGEPVADDARIPEARARLDVSANAPTFHREDETQYRFELDGIALHPTPWTDRATVSLAGLAAGTHSLRVRARDYDGRESAVQERHFTVVRPWWKTGTAGVLYAALAVVGIFAWGRSRTAAAQRQALEAEANERRIAVSESRFRRLFEDGTDPQILVLDGSVWQLNAAAELLFGRTVQDVRSQSIDVLIAGLSTHLDAGDESGRWELDARGADHDIPVEVRRTRIPLEGAVLDHLAVADLRARHRLERERADLESQLRDSQRLESVGTLAGGVAHDFNNLLTIIHTNAELAANDVAASSAAADSLRQLLVASRRAREVVRQILTFSRRTRTHRTSVRIDALLSELGSLLRAMIPSTVRIVVRAEAPGAVVEGDATLLQQLLLNLCSNAEHAMRATNGGTLTVRATWDEMPDSGAAAVRLSVSDTGVGISPEVRSRMFEPFFTTKPVGEGTGLGLSVMHGIVGEHGGTITVTSEPGHGATFDVLLPTTTVETSSALDLPSSGGGQPGPCQILLVDDEPGVTSAVRRILQRHGYVVATASNGAEAMDHLRAHRDIELVITDQTMPVMTGLELIEWLRASGRTTPVILASGFEASIDRARLDSLSGVWWMDKPFATQELLNLVATATARLRQP